MYVPPTIGRVVHYRLTADDAAAINRRRTTPADIADKIVDERWSIGAQAHIGNVAKAGDSCAAMVVAVADYGHGANLQVFLDGNDVFWVQNRPQGDDNGRWHWPPRS
jgi:hypothetical protein